MMIPKEKIKPYANLKKANLQRADLKEADLKGADLWGADLQGADLKGANLLGANLQGANLLGANFDFSFLPLWCGSFGMKVDDRFVNQILAHFARLDVSGCSGWIRYVHKTISNLYNCKNWFCNDRNDVKPI